MYINNHGTLDHTDDDKTNDLGSNPPEDTFFILKRNEKEIYASDEKNYPMIGVI